MGKNTAAEAPPALLPPEGGANPGGKVVVLTGPKAGRLLGLGLERGVRRDADRAGRVKGRVVADAGVGIHAVDDIHRHGDADPSPAALGAYGGTAGDVLYLIVVLRSHFDVPARRGELRARADPRC